MDDSLPLPSNESGSQFLYMSLWPLLKNGLK
jgi:hypothetical protein